MFRDFVVSSVERFGSQKTIHNPQYTNHGLSKKMDFFFRIYVDKEEIYSGDLTEVPQRFRKGIKEALSDWSDSLGKRGLNELVYSLFTWYNEKGEYCEKCDKWAEESDCQHCGGELKARFVYERNKKLDLLLTCVGMISRVEVFKRFFVI